MSLESIIKQKQKNLEMKPARLLSQVEKTQKKIFEEILILANDFVITNGRIELSIPNLNTVDLIIEELKTALHGSEYFEAVKEFGKDFDLQQKINEEYFTQAFDDFATPDFAAEMVRQSKVATVDALLGAPLDENFLKPLQKTLTDLVSSGASWKESVKTIREFAEGGENVDGKLLQYSKQIAHDAFSYADATYSNAVAEELDGEWYFYAGGEIPTSRCFCVERNGKYFHYKEIEAFGRGENLGECKSGDLWAGANKNTNEQTIFIYKGGHFCNHSWMLVSIFDVPKEVVQRVIDAGLYEPSQFEIEEIGL